MDSFRNGKLFPVKLVLLGDSSVGKSSFLHRLTMFHDLNQPDLIEYSQPTIGASFQIINLNHIRFEIWDTAGQERYRSLAPLYYRGAHSAIVMYDVTDHTSFLRAKEWIRIMSQHEPNCKIALISNKHDLDEHSREVEPLQEDALAVANSNILCFMRVSVKMDSRSKLVSILQKLEQAIWQEKEQQLKEEQESTSSSSETTALLGSLSSTKNTSWKNKRTSSYGYGGYCC